MNSVTDLLRKFKGNTNPFILSEEGPKSYQDFYERIEKDRTIIRSATTEASCLVLLGQNGIASYSRFIAALAEGHTVLLAAAYQFFDPDYRRLLVHETDSDFLFWDDNGVSSSEPNPNTRHPLLVSLHALGHPGFIVRTSGSSSAKYKFVLHDANKFIQKYERRGPHFTRTLAFSPADSIAGIETLLEVLTHRAVLAVEGDRLNPRKAADLLSRHDVDYFQTTPTFLNMMVLTRSFDRAKLPHLAKIAYGSEPSSSVTLQSIQDALSGIELMHTYGMSEIGIQVTETNQLAPVTFRLNYDFNPGRIVSGMVELKSMTPMLGYLNTTNTIKYSGPDSWFPTHDKVEEIDGYWQVLGREGDLINVAGRKFFPSELENIIMTLEGVGDVTVIAEKNELLGQALTVKIVSSTNESEMDFRKRFKVFCEEKVPFFMHPQKIQFFSSPSHSADDPAQGRFKKIRRL